jgi:hypothetical protein
MAIVARLGAVADRIPPRIKGPRIYQRRNAKGDPFLAFNLGPIRFYAYRDPRAERTEGTTAVWQTYLTERRQSATSAPRSDPAPREASARDPRKPRRAVRKARTSAADTSSRQRQAVAREVTMPVPG